MKSYRIIQRVLLSVFLCWAPTLLSAASKDDARGRFEAAEEALDKGDHTTFRQLADSLADYPLRPYLDYRELVDRLDKASPSEVKDFLGHHKDTPLAWQLRKRWLQQQARHGQWQTFLAFYRPTSNVTLQCQQVSALLATGKTHTAMHQAEILWLHGRSRPKACDGVFARWVKAGNPSPALAWKRIELAMEQGQLRLARYLRRYLPRAEQGQLDHWLKLHRKPELIASEKTASKPDPRGLQIQVHAIRRLARKDALAALGQWQRLSAGQLFSQAQRHAVELRLAASLLDEPASEAYDYFRTLKPASSDHKLQALRLRAALTRQQWDDYLAWLGELPPANRDQDRWQYWRARALSALGQHSEALALYGQLAERRSYHGFLAADRSGRPYAIAHNEAPTDPQALTRLQQHPALQRARELFALDRRLEARREWQWGTRGLSRDELISAAKLAEHWEWHSQAILTIAQGEYWDDLDLRFPLAHRDDVEDQARRQSLDPAWIYAVARQESAFRADARSHAGATGLMQLMPATAKRVAKRLPDKLRVNRRTLKQPEVNIALGSAYLREVLDRLYSNRVLATAAYNAGPHRVRRWLPETTVAADLWIESVPFRETRRYLQRVLTYTAIYQARMGKQPERLLDQMPDIRPAEEYASRSERQARSG